MTLVKGTSDVTSSPLWDGFLAILNVFSSVESLFSTMYKPNKICLSSMGTKMEKENGKRQ